MGEERRGEEKRGEKGKGRGEKKKGHGTHAIVQGLRDAARQSCHNDMHTRTVGSHKFKAQSVKALVSDTGTLGAPCRDLRLIAPGQHENPTPEQGPPPPGAPP